MLRHRVVTVALLSLVAAGCGDELAKASLVEGLRVLAVQAEPPEVAPDGTATFAPLVSWDGDGALKQTWTLCAIAKGPTTGYECAVPEVPLGSGETTTLAVAPLVAQAETLAAETGFPLDLEEGVTLYVRLLVESPDDRIETIKRVTVTTREPRNTNPALTGLLRDGKGWTGGEPLDVPAGQELTLRPEVAEDAAEVYTDVGGETREELLYAWFATAGEMKAPFSFDAEPDNRWTAPSLDEGETEREVTLWVVVRDGRGGAGWLERTARVVKGE